MALIQPFTTPHGAPAEYHRLIKAEYDCTAETVTMTFQVYVSAEAREAGKSPLWHEYVVIPFADLPQDPRQALYPQARYDAGYLRDAVTDEPPEAAAEV